MPANEARRITDSKVLAAMSHPLRRRLMDVLKVYGPSTATAVAGRTGQTVANVSHHLRVLDTAGLIEEAPDLARTRRERWWRLVSSAVKWSEVDFADDPASAAVADAALSLNLEHHVSLVRAWWAAGDEARAHWQDTSFSTDKWLHVTPDELAELSTQVIDLLERWATREIPEDDQRRDPVFVFSYAVPGTP
jgi:DNA-binding transcriptional ArsR family regulator